jgi:putative PIN family toxin of toxin-antitoxin system
MLDTNVLVASVIARGLCREIFDHCIQNHVIVGSAYLREEFERVLESKFGYSVKECKTAAAVVFEPLEMVKPMVGGITGIKDGSDVPIVGTAAAGQCNVLVTGDKVLARTGRVGKIEIIMCGDFFRYEASGIDR